MLIHSASQLLTLAGGPQRGAQLGTLGLIEDGAVLLREGTIAAVGHSAELRAAYPNEDSYDASGRVVMPAFVDAHSHPIWAGDRAAEFELRQQGKSYLEVLAAGGGILSTVRATRAATLEQLHAETEARLRRMFAHGSATIEAKSGYGLSLESELRLLEVLLALDAQGPWELAITFLGAHAIPAEFKDRAGDYAQELAHNWLPELKAWWLAHAGGRPLPFFDVFCETGAFDLGQTRLMLEAAKDAGFPLKLHADEFDNLGGTALAVELGAASVDHLVAISDEEIAALAASDTVGVALPATPFGLAEAHNAPARKILAAGGLLAVGGDLNPGTAWCESLQFTLALACRQLKLTQAEAIAATTINAAAAIGAAERTGSLEPGKQADLLILDVADYRQLGYRFGTNLVHSVYKKGVPYLVHQDELSTESNQ
ncbi:MAG: imidazolonepropionase [Anaerolineales bacterium]|nr:imidazolonepropionase [Anaerolineales bacterium]MBX3005766.1 imidazolonepropionase [Anaerolineales bacterium]